MPTLSLVTPLYAGLLGLIFVFLSYRIAILRKTTRVNIGSGGDSALEIKIRVQGNFAEYVPIGVLLLLMAELQGMPVWLVHVFGLALVLGRLLHAYGLPRSGISLAPRAIGMLLTFAMITLTALANMAHALL